jgi:putative membrane protein
MGMTDALLAYLHYAAMVFIALLLFVEYRTCRIGVTPQGIRLLARADLLYMMAAILALATGVIRLVWFAKGAAFYLHNPVFYIKMALFVAVGLLSIPPTMQYLKWVRALNSGARNVAEPWQLARVSRYLLTELILFALIPLMAVLMARGIGTTPATA